MATASERARSQTLSRGIRMLELLASADRPPTIDELAEGLAMLGRVLRGLVRG